MIDDAAHYQDAQKPILSICISTLNRAAFIGETLDSIVAQITSGVEVVVVDGNSSDSTKEIISAYCTRHANFRYFLEEENSGIDGDYDKAVNYARGQYCWLFPDDDLMAPGAMRTVLEYLDGQTSLIVVDAEVRNVDLSEILEARRLGFSGVRDYEEKDSDRFMSDAGNALSFIGATIIRRDIWLARDRQSYYGTLFVHVGVIFQQTLPGRAIVIGAPLISIRLGNAMWTPKSFEIWMFKWPELIWSFDKYSSAARNQVIEKEPWRSMKTLISFRSNGAYGFNEFKRYFSDRKLGWMKVVLLFVALTPGRALNCLSVLYIVLFRPNNEAGLYNLLQGSRYSNGISRRLVRIFRRKNYAV